MRYQEITEVPLEKDENIKTDSASVSVSISPQVSPLETNASEAMKVSNMEFPNETEGLNE